jgi:ribosome-binding protein aMBF1 (putative translation factor)
MKGLNLSEHHVGKEGGFQAMTKPRKVAKPKGRRPRPSTKPVEREPKVKVPWDDDIGAALKADREARGLTRVALANACGVSASRIRELERNLDPKGRPTHPSPRLAKALASWFKAHPAPMPAKPGPATHAGSSAS